MGEIDGAFRAWGIPKGGTGGISNAIGSAARAQGAEIRMEARVGRILVRNGRAVGVALEDGEEILADAVLSSLDSRQTFINLLEPGTLDAGFEAEVRRFKFRGSSGKVNMALDGLPSFTALPGPGEHLRGAISISPSTDEMEQAYDDAKYGHWSRRPYIDIVIPTLVDPGMAPPGKHVMSCFVQYAPYHLDPSLGTWDDNREAFGDAVVDRISEFAPDLKSKILFRNVQTPLDIERTTGLTEGNIFQGELSLEQLFFSRPVPGWARFRTPVRDLWLCGSRHPSGRRDHGRQRPDRGDGAPPVPREAGGVMATNGTATAARPWDAIIVGGGHNALVTAAYLAKGGLRTLVLERRERLGGAADTSELAKGFRVPTLAHTVGRLRPSVHRDLDLKRHGLALMAPDVRVFAPSPDGRAVTFWDDTARTVEALRSISAADADAYPGFDRLVRSLGKFLDELGRSTPVDVKAPGSLTRSPA
jgi:phytoene dehydrogenase-like protein